MDKQDVIIMNLISVVFLGHLSYVVESKRRNIKQHQVEVIAFAKQKGIRFGRPSTELPDNWDSVIADWKSGEINAVEAMKRAGIKRSSFYKSVDK